MRCGNGPLVPDPGEDVVFGRIQKALELVQFPFVHALEPRLGEAAEHEVRFLEAAPLCPKAQTLSPDGDMIAPFITHGRTI